MLNVTVKAQVYIQNSNLKYLSVNTEGKNPGMELALV